MKTLITILITAISTACILACIAYYGYVEIESDNDQLMAIYINDERVYTTDSICDVPYLLWKDDTTALVYQLCSNQRVSEEFTSSDTITFSSLCTHVSGEYKIPISKPEVAPLEMRGISKIFTVSDIHGEYEYFIELLRNAGIVDSDLNWKWGDGHLVINGDVTDRGDRVTESLWLLYKLEKQALLAGGRVHLVLGNHEIMVMQGDLRYVHWKYMEKTAKRLRVSYDDLFGPKTELGRWLRTKNVSLQLDSILFIHGGISPQFIEKGFTAESYSEYIREHLDGRSYDRRIDSTHNVMFGTHSPFWYRGHVTENRYPRSTDEEIQSVKEYFGVNAVVVGHSEVDSVECFYDCSVYAVDVPADELSSLQGLLWENYKFFRVKGDGEKVGL